MSDAVAPAPAPDPVLEPASHPTGRPHDVRLVVVDMDGTLLDASGQIPEELWPMLDRLRAEGVVFAPASGRQYATLSAMFDRARDGMVFIAENGSYVVRDDQELSSTVVDGATVAGIVAAMRELAATGVDLGVIVCGKRSAYVERTDRAFLDNVDPYYANLTEVPDLLEVEDEVVKVAVFGFADPGTTTAPALDPFRATHQVVGSGERWVDIMHQDADKGVAVRRLQDELGVTPAQTVVFGDYLNDLEMIDAAELSFAMANAHPEVLARARYRAPANTENGVITTLVDLLDGRGVTVAGS